MKNRQIAKGIIETRKNGKKKHGQLTFSEFKWMKELKGEVFHYEDIISFLLILNFTNRFMFAIV